MEKPNAIFLPGLLNDARLYQHQVAALSKEINITVADITVADSMPALAAAVLAKAPPRFALVGLSMGGYVAFEIMRQAPERITKLALLDTTARPDTPESTANRRRLIELADKDFNAVIDALAPKMFYPPHLNDASRGGLFKAMATTVGKDAFIRQQRAIIGRIDSRPHLGNIKCPTTVLCGREDALTPPELHEEIKNGIPGATLTVVDQSGHLSPIEQPQVVTTALQKWLLGKN